MPVPPSSRHAAWKTGKAWMPRSASAASGGGAEAAISASVA